MEHCQRTHVLDWAARFDRMEFSEAPEGCLPKKRPKKMQIMTPGQIRTEVYNQIRAGSNHKGMRVNSTPEGEQRRREQQRTPTAGFAGERVLSIEQQWRTACTA